MQISVKMYLENTMSSCSKFQCAANCTYETEFT